LYVSYVTEGVNIYDVNSKVMVGSFLVLVDPTSHYLNRRLLLRSDTSRARHTQWRYFPIDIDRIILRHRNTLQVKRLTYFSVISQAARSNLAWGLVLNAPVGFASPRSCLCSDAGGGGWRPLSQNRLFI